MSSFACTVLSPIHHLLSTPLLHLGLSLTRPSCSLLLHTFIASTSHHTTHPLPHSGIRCPRRPNAIQHREDHPPPRPIPRKRNEHHIPPSPVNNIPHPLRQPLGLEILASALELAILVDGTGNSFEPEFEEQGRSVEKGVFEDASSLEY